MVPPALKLMLLIIDVVLTWCWISYSFSSSAILLCRAFRPDVKFTAANIVWYYFKWPALAYLIGDPIIQGLTGNKLDLWDILTTSMCAVSWWLYRDLGDDDDHKKLKKKLKEKVRAVGSKLVVVPEPA